MIKLFDEKIMPDNASLLEPSAGEGSLVDAVRRGYPVKYRCGNHDEEEDYYQHTFNVQIFCIESNKTRQATLKGKKYLVIWDDFLTFDPMMRYSAILMNPPFNNGARHLLKALDVCAAGGQIVCLLNAETIKNPCTNERKALLAKLEEQEICKIQYETAAFANAERSTDVEIAIVYVRKAKTDNVCVTFDNFKRQTFARRKEEQAQTGLVRYGEIDALIDIYQAEVKAALTLWREVQNYGKIAIAGLENTTTSQGVFKIEVNTVGGNDYTPEANIVRRINYKYWQVLLYSKEMSHLMTGRIQIEYRQKLIDMANFEFNERNIAAMKEDLSRNLLTNIDKAIMEVWEEFTSRHTYSEYSKNIHYYNGWCTNNAFRCNKKIILPLNAYGYQGDRFDTYRVRETLSDIEKAMNYLDSGRTEHFEMACVLERAAKTGLTKNINTKFFWVTCYKKGTCHLTFKDMDLLKKFNIYCGKKKNWLPGDYGQKPYSHLSKEEMDIVESFEGVDSYMDTHLNKDFYLQGTGDMLMLGAGSKAVGG